MDKIAKQLHNIGLDLKQIESFLVWYKSHKYNVQTLEQDILSSNSNTFNFFKTQLPSKQHAFYILKHTLQQKQDQYVKVQHDINCVLINCPSLKRIIDALKYYKTLYNNNKKNSIIFNQLIVKYFEKKYKYIISDYHHMLFAHLNQSKLKHIQNYDMIHNAVYKNKLQCNILQCEQYKRYQTDREQLYIATSEHKDNDTSHKVTLYQDLMDTIHAYFVHAFNDGSRLTINELSSMKQTTPNYDDVSDESSISVKDDNLTQLQRLLSNKKEQIRKLRGNKRMTYNKFNNNCNTSDAINDEKREEKQTNCIGMRYYYWDYYKNKEEEDTIYHPGDAYKDWYVVKKYDNFKQEFVSNKIHAIDISVFNYIYYKASMFIQQSDFIQSHKSSMVPIYGIGEDYKITVDIMMALIFYTDFELLRAGFLQTFTQLTPLETDELLKERNAEFWHFSKIILQTVECYGTQLIDQKLQVFYTTFNAKSSCFNDMDLMFCAPISCTPHIEIATVYSDSEGIMLELCAKDYSLKLFNCSFVSSFALEEEILFCGGRKPLTVHSMICLDANENYRVFVKAIALFNQLMDGLLAPNKQMVEASNMDYFIVHCLIRHKLKIRGYKNSFVEYVNDTFHRCCVRKQYVKIDVKHIMNHYAGFRLICFSSKCDNLVLLDKISRLFTNCVTITVNMAEHEAVTANYLLLLMQMMENINKSTNIKLSTIEFTHIDMKCDDEEVKKYKSSIAKKNWSLSIEQKKNQYNLCLVRTFHA